MKQRRPAESKSVESASEEPKPEQVLPKLKAAPKVLSPKGPPVLKKPSSWKSLPPDEKEQVLPDQIRDSAGSGTRVGAEPAPSNSTDSKPPLKKADESEAQKFRNLFWNSSNRKREMSKGHQNSMRRLRSGDLEGPQPKRSQFLELVNDKGEGIVITEDPRSISEYKDRCVQEASLGKHFDQSRYPELKSQPDRELLEWAVRRGSDCIWLGGLE